MPMTENTKLFGGLQSRSLHRRAAPAAAIRLVNFQVRRKVRRKRPNYVTSRRDTYAPENT